MYSYGESLIEYGEAKGRKIGRREGIQEGRLEGIQEGRLEAIYRAIPRLISKGYSFDDAFDMIADPEMDREAVRQHIFPPET